MDIRHNVHDVHDVHDARRYHRRVWGGFSCSHESIVVHLIDHSVHLLIICDVYTACTTDRLPSRSLIVIADWYYTHAVHYHTIISSLCRAIHLALSAQTSQSTSWTTSSTLHCPSTPHSSSWVWVALARVESALSTLAKAGSRAVSPMPCW